jgi:hypothetical protein
LRQQVVDVGEHRGPGRLRAQPALGGRGEERGDVVLEPDQLGAGLLARGRVVAGQPTGVGEQRDDVVGPQGAELVGGRRIQEWARQHGHKVANRGRIAANVIEAYEKTAG